ncbi:4Fe-4S binding protein [Tepidibacter hydrothermalis]|uniref:4Fe-4S binding protein n=1 Tax=Tepidibacter hydrothermalis TaxID=3036126 RepID=A0ABY8EH38_9FIRM|nr:4Fe-4S binding protein [Tepidibacter hydrothermalis]WFD10078.1 4Fe-4S binding protein [Tepidibacter hydrothermalis]
MRRFVPRLRWITLIISFVLLTFGVQILGKRIYDLKLPIMSCVYNKDYLVEGSCYTITEFGEWLISSLTLGNIMSVLLFILSTLILIVIFGRILCGFICPFGFIQDVLTFIREKLHIPAFRFSEKTRNKLKLLKWILLFIFLVGIELCELCPVRAIIPPLTGSGFEMDGLSVLIAIVVIVGGFFKNRLWCNYCPMGYFVGVFHKFSFIKLKKDCTACTECGVCYEACPMDIKSIYTEREKEDITTSDCIFCMKCIDSCPEDKAIKTTFLGKSIYSSSRENFHENHITYGKFKQKKDVSKLWTTSKNEEEVK